MKRFIAYIVQESSDKVGHEVWISLRKGEYASYQFRCRPGEVYEMLLRIRMSSAIGTCMAFDTVLSSIGTKEDQVFKMLACALSVNLEF